MIYMIITVLNSIINSSKISKILKYLKYNFSKLLVTFETHDSALWAVNEFNGKVINDRKLDVSLAVDREGGSDRTKSKKFQGT